MISALTSRFKPITLIFLSGLMLVLIYQFTFLIRVIWFNYYNPQSSAIMRQTISELRLENPKSQLVFEWVDYDNISEHLKRAVISSEDANFLIHKGIEWEAIRSAWVYNKQQAAKGSERRRGGSTLTQQLAKNLFLSSSRSYRRKAQELILSYMIETVMSKRRILELYLNVAQWGAVDFGAQAAAHRYYKTTANRLSASQSARLAAMLPNPVFYDKNRNTPYLQRRTNTIVQRMRQVSAP